MLIFSGKAATCFLYLSACWRWRSRFYALRLWHKTVATIQKLENTLAAVNKADATVVSSMYLEDAFSPREMAADFARCLRCERLHIEGGQFQLCSGLNAFLHTAAMSLRPAEILSWSDGELKTRPPRDVQGKYLIVWRKIGTGWKISTDIWNGNNAPWA